MTFEEFLLELLKDIQALIEIQKFNNDD